MQRQSPFAQEWLNCLREHYKQTVRENDRATLTISVRMSRTTGRRGS